jgi:surface protein
MYSVRIINLSGWDTTKWKVTNIHYMFYYDFNLEKINGFWNWNVSGWPVTNGLYQMFYQCHSLKEVDFSNWVTTNFAFGGAGKCDLRYMFGYDYSIKKIDLSSFNIDAIDSLNYYAQSAAGSRSYSPFYLCYNLEELTLPQNYKGHIDLSDMYELPRSEFIKVFNALSSSPIGTTAKVWIINTKYKLTTADIAIATNKGYTVVQS